MARSHGKNTMIFVGGTQILGCDTSEYPRAADVHDTTEYGLEGHRSEGGLKSATSFTLGGVYHKKGDAGAGNPALLLEGNEGDSFVITDMPEGIGSGLPRSVFTAVLAEFKQSRPVADYIRWTASFTISHDPAVNDNAQTS